jgi:hypothetical protein
VFSGSTLRDVIIHLQKQLEQALLRNRNLTQVTRDRIRMDSMDLDVHHLLFSPIRMKYLSMYP